MKNDKRNEATYQSRPLSDPLLACVGPFRKDRRHEEQNKLLLLLCWGSLLVILSSQVFMRCWCGALRASTYQLSRPPLGKECLPRLVVGHS